VDFNPAPPSVMHVDLNSCFATVEQQANPHLRGRPVAVAAYAENHGCILAASVEAKRLGIKTGMRVRDGRAICKELVVLPPDPDKYRYVNHALRAVLSAYSSHVCVESIDEMVMDICEPAKILEIAKEIKMRIKKEIGEWLTVSIGIAPNRYLAKIASGITKPDGLDMITRENIDMIFSSMKLEDLCGIKEATANRLRYAGIRTPLELCLADSKKLELAFHSIMGRHWYMRLHGYEDGSRYTSFGVNEKEQKSFGQSYALGKPYAPQESELHQVLSQLVMKMGRRLRTDGFSARGIGVSTLFADYSHWHLQHAYDNDFYADDDFYKRMKNMLFEAPARPVRILAVYCYKLQAVSMQENLFEEDNRKRNVTDAIDSVHNRWGDFVVTSGRMLNAKQRIVDRIAFGKAGV
jgi:DNA polymerase-4